jgi:hypothetical protein
MSAIHNADKYRKNPGQATVDLHVLCGSRAAASHLIEHFARRARLSLKTVTHYKWEINDRGPHDIVVSIQYRHTCINEGNTYSDARRFVKNAFRNTTYRYEIQLTRKKWKVAA